MRAVEKTLSHLEDWIAKSRTAGAKDKHKRKKRAGVHYPKNENEWAYHKRMQQYHSDQGDFHAGTIDKLYSPGLPRSKMIAHHQKIDKLAKLHLKALLAHHKAAENLAPEMSHKDHEKLWEKHDIENTSDAYSEVPNLTRFKPYNSREHDPHEGTFLEELLNPDQSPRGGYDGKAKKKVKKK